MSLVMIYMSIFMLALTVHVYFRTRKRITIIQPAVRLLFGSVLTLSIFVIITAIDPRTMNEKYEGGLGLFKLLTELVIVFLFPTTVFLTGRARWLWSVQSIDREDLYNSVLDVLARNSLACKEVVVEDPVAKDMAKEVILVDHDASVTVTGVLTTYDHAFYIKNAKNIPEFRKVLSDLMCTIRSQEFQAGMAFKILLFLLIFMSALTILFFSLIKIL